MIVRDLIKALMDNADLDDEVILEILVDDRYYQGEACELLVTEDDKMIVAGHVCDIIRKKELMPHENIRIRNRIK